jgi:tRNA G10  N-methylase Trm11
MQSLTVLGRQPAIGLAELESLYGQEKITPVGEKVAVIDVDPCLLAFDRLGGSIKFCKVLTVLDTVNWKEIEEFLINVSPGHSQNMPPGKMRLGISAIGFSMNLKQLEKTGLTLKKAIKATGRNVRVIPNKELELNTAQVLHNQLTGQTGWELILIKDRTKTVIAQTVKAQDIDSYTKRDRGRPKRDARVGMLPPKLAQVIINLAAGKLPEDKLLSICDIPADQPIPKPLLNQNLLDPFCGTGVLLQEALLMGYNVCGSDIDKRMVDYSHSNILDWLKAWYDFETDVRLEEADATNANWSIFPEINFVASETYLGRPFTSPPGNEILEQTVSECNLIIKKFLKNISPQIKPSTRLCIALPAWQISPGKFRHLPLVDQISDMGYNRIKLEYASAEDLIYYRTEQIVGRQLLLITRK